MATRRGSKSPFKPSVREQREQNHAAMDMYAKLSGKPTPPEQLTLQVMKPKQVRRAQGATGKPLEKTIRAAVVKALRAHPLVSAVSINYSGNMAGYQIGIRGKGDLSIKLRSGGWGECELKMPGRKPTPVQFQRAETVRKQGGFWFWADSVDGAVRLLEACARTGAA